MIEKLVPIKLPPGIYRNGTTYQAAWRWFDSHLVRWTDGTIQPVGGWRSAEAADGGALEALTGVARGALAYRGSAGAIRIGVGTHARLYAIVDGNLYDITPTGFVAGDADSVYAGGTGTYGSGVYGSGVYGTGSLALVLDEADTWQLDNFGDYLVGCFTEDGKIYLWDGNTGNVAVQATDSPENCSAVVVTPERFLVALGADGNVRLVKWASQETTDTWTAASDNTAGEFELATNGRLMAGRRYRHQTLLWTDTDLHVMHYIGGSLVYSFDKAGGACGLIAPNAVAMVDARVFWMGKNGFFAFDGAVRPVPSEVRDYVFGDFNEAQRAKIWAMPISEFNEVWWFYCSAGSTEIDRYVSYNYVEGHWALGELSRTAGFDRDVVPYPTMGEEEFASLGTLTSTGTNPSDGDTVTIGSKTYTFQTTLTDVDGNVHIGATAADSLDNLFRAINLGPGAGTDYATSMTAHPTVRAGLLTSTTIVVHAIASGSGGNAIATTEVSSQLSWGGSTLASGGTTSGFPVTVLQEHEVGEDRGSEVPYLESGPMEIADGDRLVRVQSLVPDDRTLGDVQARFYSANFPTQTETEHGPYTLANPTSVRFTARQVRLRLEQAQETSWRVGTVRLGVIQSSRR